MNTQLRNTLATMAMTPAIIEIQVLPRPPYHAPNASMPIIAPIDIKRIFM